MRSAREQERQEERDRHDAFLRKLLSHGPRPRREVHAKAGERGIRVGSEIGLSSAKRRVGVVVVKSKGSGRRGVRYLALPDGWDGEMFEFAQPFRG